MRNQRNRRKEEEEGNFSKPVPSFSFFRSPLSLLPTIFYNKTTKFGPKKFLKINDYEKPTKKEARKEEEGNFPKPLPSFSFFRPLLSSLPTT